LYPNVGSKEEVYDTNLLSVLKVSHRFHIILRYKVDTLGRRGTIGQTPIEGDTMRYLFVLVCLLLTACGGGQTAQAPAAKAVTPDDVIAAFKAAGLEAENARAMTKEDYGMAPMLCDGRRFFIPSLGPNNGGRVFVCPNATDRDKLATFYRELGKASAALFTHALVKGNVVVQLNGDLSEEQAKKYEAAIP
jgi:hypothetical protein